MEFPDILNFLSCPDKVEELYTFESPTLSQLTNGTYCSSTNQELPIDELTEGHILRCDIIGYPGMDVCKKTEGSHSTTFYSYLVARMAYDWMYKGVYAVLDGTSMRLCEEHNSDYSKISLTNGIASLISSLIPALVLVDAEEGSGGWVTLLMPNLCVI